MDRKAWTSLAAALTLRGMHVLAADNRGVRELSRAGHGVPMFSAEPSLRPAIAHWLVKVLARRSSLRRATSFAIMIAPWTGAMMPDKSVHLFAVDGYADW